MRTGHIGVLIIDFIVFYFGFPLAKCNEYYNENVF